MVVVRPCLKSVSRWLPGCSGKPRPWRLAALGVALFACSLAAGEAPVQSDGCARCGAAPAVLAPRARPQRSWRKEARRETRAKRKLAMAIGWAGGSYAVCVRACDGSFFPVSYFGAANRSDRLEQVCRSLCPNADMTLYSFPFGGTIEEAVSSAGEPYARLPNAGKFEQTYDPGCSCRAPGQSWAEALADAEAKYGRHSHDILVTVADAERMSRPVRPAAADPAQPGAATRPSYSTASTSTASTRRSAPRPQRSAAGVQASATRMRNAL